MRLEYFVYHETRRCVLLNTLRRCTKGRLLVDGFEFSPFLLFFAVASLTSSFLVTWKLFNINFILSRVKTQSSENAFFYLGCLPLAASLLHNYLLMYVYSPTTITNPKKKIMLTLLLGLLQEFQASQRAVNCSKLQLLLSLAHPYNFTTCLLEEHSVSFPPPLYTLLFFFRNIAQVAKF